MDDAPILVTGGSGFLGSHMVLELLKRGHSVRTTVRRRERREPDMRAMFAEAGLASDALDRLSFVEADLGKDDGWDAAVAGCRHVHHVASPFPPGTPKHEDELIVPAREGTLRVLRAAQRAGVERVVQTSSFAAVGLGHSERTDVYDETYWTNVDGDISAYSKSKTLAERAAWQCVEGGAMELAVVNPVLILGPLLGEQQSTSIEVVRRILNGMPGCPRISFGLVDVRDVVDLHVRAMTHPEAAGERFLAICGQTMSIQDIARKLKRQFPERGRRIRTRPIPDVFVRIAALFDGSARQIVSQLGKDKQASNDKARNTLGWEPRSAEEMLRDTAERLFELGLVKS